MDWYARMVQMRPCIRMHMSAIVYANRLCCELATHMGVAFAYFIIVIFEVDLFCRRTPQTQTSRPVAPLAVCIVVSKAQISVHIPGFLAHTLYCLLVQIFAMLAHFGPVRQKLFLDTLFAKYLLLFRYD